MKVGWDFNSAPAQGEERPQERIDAEQVKSALVANLEGVLGHLYPNGFAEPKGRVFYIGDTRGTAGESLNVQLQGESAGLWYDFATGDGGDILDLWREARGFGTFQDTLRDAASYTGAVQAVPRKLPRRKASKKTCHGVPAHTYQYRDAAGNIIAEVDRFEWINDAGEKKKAFRPWDVKQRAFRAPDPRPLYNLPQVATSPEIIFVEGEKCADALIAQGICATCAMSGSNAPTDKTDWSVLSGRMVAIWPDNDTPGKKYAEAVSAAVSAAGAASVSILAPPNGKPEKWDAADAAAEGYSLHEIIRGMRAESTGGTTPWRMQSAREFIADFVAPEYLIEGICQRGRLYTMTAPTGSGKTGVMLYAGITIATGAQFADKEVEQGDVLFLAGENPDDVRARVIGTLEYHKIDPTNLRMHFIPSTFSIRQDMEALRAAARELPNLILIVVDTLAAYFDGEDDNSNAQILDFARVLRKFTFWPSKPCVIVPSHPVKDVRKSNLVPRGGGALLNEVDGNLTLWKEDDLITFHWQGKHRGPDFEPLNFELVSYTTETLKDRNGRLMPTVLAKPVLGLRAADLARQSVSIETAILRSFDTEPNLPQRDRAARLGIARTAMQRRIDKMKDRKWLKAKGRKLELTEQGREAMEDGLNGCDGGPE